MRPSTLPLIHINKSRIDGPTDRKVLLCNSQAVKMLSGLGALTLAASGNCYIEKKHRYNVV